MVTQRGNPGFLYQGASHDAGYGAPHEKHMLEEENDKMVDALSNKVQALKSVSFIEIVTNITLHHIILTNLFSHKLTIDIGNEVRTQNKMLKGMVSKQYKLPKLAVLL